jgi:starch-binding outer membrane protein, SusD/RagB family
MFGSHVAQILRRLRRVCARYRSEPVFVLASATSGAPGSSLTAWTYPRVLGPSVVGGWSTIEPNLAHYDSYAEGDYRREVTYRTEGADIDGVVRPFAHPSIYKWRPTAVPGPQDMNTPIYRYAEVLLIYAEALNELGQSAEAVEWVNAVRARARSGTGNENRAEPADLPALGQDALREAILDERRWELAHEGKRWLDLIRLDPDDFVARFADHPYVSSVPARAMLWPIPQRERDLSASLTQNEGY